MAEDQCRCYCMGTQQPGARLGLQSAVTGIRWRWELASLCLKIQGSPPEAEGMEEPGEEVLSLGAVRLEAVEGGKVQEVLLSPGSARCNGTGWKLQCLQQPWENTKCFNSASYLFRAPGSWVLQPGLRAWLCTKPAVGYPGFWTCLSPSSAALSSSCPSLSRAPGGPDSRSRGQREPAVPRRGLSPTAGHLVPAGWGASDGLAPATCCFQPAGSCRAPH